MDALDPHHYLKHSKIQLGLAAELIERVLLKGDERLLDVGSGDGKITAFLQELLPQGVAVGVDNSEKMVAFAQEMFPHIRFERQNAEEMVFEAPFDTIVSFSALQWVRRPEKALERMHASLKPGGFVHILTFPLESPYWRPLEKTLQQKPFTLFRHLAQEGFTTETLCHMATQAGFVVQNAEVEQREAAHENLESVKDYIRGWIPSYISLPPTLLPSFLDAVALQLAGQAIDKNDGLIHLPYKKLTLILKK